MVQRYENASTGLTKIVAVIPKSDKDGELYCMATVCMPNSNVGPQEAKLDSTAEPWLPPGFRFHPTDEELVSYYLTKKVVDSNFAVHAIAEVDLNKCEPWDLPEKAKMGEKEWYFFSLRDRKYPTGMRTNRATDAGYWKATGKDRDVVSNRPSILVGMKKTLVFYRGRAPKGEKTNWIMHEYRLEGDNSHSQSSRVNKDEWVVCRIFQKSSGGKKSFLYSDSRMRQALSYELDDARSSLPSLLDHSANPTITDEGNCTDCDTCAATDQVSCYDVHETANMNHKENTAPLSWIGRPKPGMGLPQTGLLNSAAMEILHQGGGHLSSNMLKPYPMYDSYDAGAKNLNMSRVGFNPQTFGSSNLMAFKSLDPTNFRTGVRPKAEPSMCEGEDEAQSCPPVLDYDCWGGGGTSLFHMDAGGSTLPLQSWTGTESSCLSEGNLYSGEHGSLFNRFKYGVPDVAALVDSEILWAY